MATRAFTLFFFALVLVAATSLQPAVALEAGLTSEDIQGVIERRGEQTFIRLHKVRDPLPVYGMTQSLALDLQRLSSGDFVLGSGRILKDKKVVALDSIDTVGLKQLLGAWRTENWQVFEFKDFNCLNLYVPNRAERATPVLAPHRQMTYTLAPDTGENNWSIFMADRKSVHIGSLTILPKHLSLTIYNSDTGQVSQSLELAPMSRSK